MKAARSRETPTRRQRRDEATRHTRHPHGKSTHSLTAIKHHNASSRPAAPASQLGERPYCSCTFKSACCKQTPKKMAIPLQQKAQHSKTAAAASGTSICSICAVRSTRSCVHSKSGNNRSSNNAAQFSAGLSAPYSVAAFAVAASAVAFEAATSSATARQHLGGRQDLTRRRLVPLRCHVNGSVTRVGAHVWRRLLRPGWWKVWVKVACM